MGLAPGPFPRSHSIAAVGLVLLFAGSCAERDDEAPPPRIQVDPSEVRLEVGEEATLQAASFDESGRSLGAVSAEWSSRDPSVAQVSPEGVVRGVSVGEAVVVASSAEVRGTASVLVEAAKVTSVRIEPERLRVFPGETAALAATPLSARGQPIEGLEPPTWTSDDPEIVSVSTAGILSARSRGAASVSARIGGVNGSVPFVVTPRVAVIRVEPDELSILEGESARVRAVLVGSNGEVLGDREVEWSAHDASVATIDAEGEVTALVPGKTALYAEAEGVVGLATATVRARLTSLRVEPASAVLQVGAILGLRALVTDSLGTERSGVGCRWQAASPDRLWVGPTGGIRALGEGEGTISVECEGLEATGMVQVVAPGALQIVGPDRVVVEDEIQLQVQKDGAAPHGVIEWETGDPLLVSVTDAGTVAGVRPGKPQVFAAAEGRSASRAIASVMRFDQLLAAPFFTCGRTAAKGTFFCWGDTKLGRWGESNDPSPVPFFVVEPRRPTEQYQLDKLFVGGEGKVRAVGITTDGRDVGWFSGAHELAEDPYGFAPLGFPEDPSERIVEMALGDTYEFRVASSICRGKVRIERSCGLDSQGRAWCWGAAAFGGLGNGELSYGVGDSTVCLGSSRPVRVATDLRFVQLVVGLAHACGVTTGGEAWCWGTGGIVDEEGQPLLAGSGQAVPTLLQGGHLFRRITSGKFHACAVDSSGAAWCWGHSKRGALGAGFLGTSETPVQVSGGLGFSDISASTEHTCGLTSAGKVYCWGLGQTTPVSVGLSGTYTQVVTGARHACALRSDRTTVCWGDNSLYQVGDEREQTEGLSPRPIYPENLER